MTARDPQVCIEEPGRAKLDELKERTRHSFTRLTTLAVFALGKLTSKQIDALNSEVPVTRGTPGRPRTKS
jgi:hypothetical protein